MTAEGGTLNGPNPYMTPEMPTAIQSIKRLADLDIDTIVCYHGGVVNEGANEQLRRVIQEASRDGDESEETLVPVSAKLAKTPSSRRGTRLGPSRPSSRLETNPYACRQVRTVATTYVLQG